MSEQFTVYNWMSIALGLKGNELLVFAYIYNGINQDGYCVSSLWQIAENTNISIDTARTITTSLARQDMLTKDKYYNKDNRVVGCIYKLSNYMINFLHEIGIWHKEEEDNE